MSDILHLPYPYEQFNKISRYRENYDFENYKTRIFGWVDKNKSLLTDAQKEQWLRKKYYNLINKDDPVNNAIFKLLSSHLDKLIVFYDFSGIEFGISINERFEIFQIFSPSHIDPDDYDLYPNYNIDIFKSLSPIEKINWMLENCKFIPIRVIPEGITICDSSNYGQSYKWSHIKRDNAILHLLEHYLSELTYQPNENVYYYIIYSKNRGYHVLMRDTVSSPKNNIKKDVT